MDNKTRQGNTMVIVIIVVVAIAIIGYLVYDNNQKKQAEAEAQVAVAQQQTEQAQQQAAQVEAEAQAQKAATEKAVDTAQAEAKATASANTAAKASATCEENVANAQKNLPHLEDYAETLEKGGEIIEDNPDAAVAQCRETHEGLSKPECETKIDNFIAGKEDLYAEIEAEIATAEALIAAGC